LIYRIINSPFGEVLKAIRENEPREDKIRGNRPSAEILTPNQLAN
jgi:hypothetical protein